MNDIITIIGVAIVVLGIVALITKIIKNQKSKKIGITLIIVGVVVFILGNCFTIVPTGYTGVRTTFGQISEDVVNQGFNAQIPFVQTVELVNNKQQDITISDKIWGETQERTPVYAGNIEVTYQVNSSKSAWIYANVTDIDHLISEGLVASAVKSAMVELTADSVTNRTKIEPLVKEKLADSISEKYSGDAVVILKIVVNEMDFEDSYNEAIAAKSIAQQNYEKQTIENNTAISKAEADKKVAITNAEAEAEAKKIAAQAEAEANEVISKSLTDSVLKSKFYEKWDGKLPTVMSDGSVITDIGSIAE